MEKIPYGGWINCIRLANQAAPSKTKRNNHEITYQTQIEPCKPRG